MADGNEDAPRERGVSKAEVMTTRSTSETELDVAREDEQAYARHSYHEYVGAWNDLVQKLEAARGAGDLSMASRLAEELRHIWPQPADVSHVAWIAEPEREIALSSDQGL